MRRLADCRCENFHGGRITELSLYKGDTYKLELESGQTFFLNCALVADYDLYEGGEMDAELLEKLLALAQGALRVLKGEEKAQEYRRPRPEDNN